jgi:hypothetical protein
MATINGRKKADRNWLPDQAQEDERRQNWQEFLVDELYIRGLFSN